MQLFYSDQIDQQLCELSEEESRHCISVLRKKLGESIQLIDGKGGWHEAEIIEAHPKHCRVQIIKTNIVPPRNRYLHIAIAPTKNMDRFEWFIEKAVELGVDEISPLICDNSERKVLKLDRIHRITLSAMKQSMNIYYPKINDLRTFNSFVPLAFDGVKVIAHCDITQQRTMLHTLMATRQLVLIGPEGDFSTDEVKLALASGFQPVSFGESRLRTETAGVYACALHQLVNN